MTQPARGYQPYQPMAPMMAAPKPPRGGLTTMIAGVLALVVAGLAVGGSFGAVSTYRNSYEIEDDPSVYASKTTWWGFFDDGSSSPIENDSILSGFTLVLAAALLVAGAVFAFFSPRSSGARSLISAGVGVIAGVSLLQLLALLDQMEQYNSQELDAGESLEFSPGLGMWLPLGAVLLGIVTVVLAHLGGREVRVEPNTPRMGFPAPYGYRPMAPRSPEVHIPDEVASADTQVVSEATVSAAESAPVTPPASAAPPAAVVSEAVTSPGTLPSAPVETPAAPADSTPPAAAPTSTEAPATPAETPATPAAPAATPATSAAEAPATPAAEPTSPAEPSSVESPSAPADPAATPEAPAAPAPAAPAGSAASTASPATPAEPAATPPPAAPAPAAPAATPAPVQEPAKPTPLSDLPAAPPAPELSSSDDKSDK